MGDTRQSAPRTRRQQCFQATRAGAGAPKGRQPALALRVASIQQQLEHKWSPQQNDHSLHEQQGQEAGAGPSRSRGLEARCR